MNVAKENEFLKQLKRIADAMNLLMKIDEDLRTQNAKLEEIEETLRWMRG